MFFPELNLFQEIIFTMTYIVLSVYSFKRVLKGLQILQQSFYSNRRFFAWYEKRMPSFEEIGIFSLTFIMVFWNIAVYHIISMIFLSYYIFRKEPQKKPLKVTPRVHRLLILMILVLVGFVYVLVRYLHLDRTPSIFFMTVLSYFIIMFINFVDKPLNHLIHRRFIHKSMKKYQRLTSLEAIGITGSYGKTTTKNIVAQILNRTKKTVPTPASYNTPMGICISINDYVKEDTDYFVAEMGAFKRGEIKYLADIVKPKYGILTTVGVQHLETFKTQENITKTKFELIESLPNDGIGLINIDNENIRNYNVNTKARVVTFGIEKNADYKANIISITPQGQTIQVLYQEDLLVELQTSLLGKHNVYNILSAVALANELGVPLHEIKIAVNQLEPVEHRLQIKTMDQLVLIDDSYNSNPEGAKSALEVLDYFEGKKYIITPGFVELGESQKYFNHQFGCDMVGHIDAVILVGLEQTEEIFRGLTTNKFLGEIHRVQTFDAAMERFYEIYNGNEAVLLIENDLPDCYI